MGQAWRSSGKGLEGTHLGGSLRLVGMLLCYQLSGNSASCSWGPRSPSLRAQSVAAGTLLAIASYCSLPFYGLTTEMVQVTEPLDSKAGCVILSLPRGPRPPRWASSRASSRALLSWRAALALPLFCCSRRCGAGGVALLQREGEAVHTGCYLLTSPWFLPGLGAGRHGARRAGGEGLARKGTWLSTPSL